MYLAASRGSFSSPQMADRIKMNNTYDHKCPEVPNLLESRGRFLQMNSE